MTSPSPTNGSPRSTSASGTGRSGFAAAATPPDHRALALQSAVAMLRGRNLTTTEEVLSMATSFYVFLKLGDR